MTRHIPNLLTAGRFFLALGFFVVMWFYDPRDPPNDRRFVLEIGIVVFLVGVLTDAIDGWLARYLGHLTTFGRIADPFVDKIIVCGALAFFLGYPFVRVTETGMENLTGWHPWMVAVILARELLVTGMRSFSESHHMPFAATLSGKIKMFLQCVAITCSLVYVAYWADGPGWTSILRDVFIWTATLFTALSGLVYVKRAYHLLKMPPD